MIIGILKDIKEGENLSLIHIYGEGCAVYETDYRRRTDFKYKGWNHLPGVGEKFSEEI